MKLISSTITLFFLLIFNFTQAQIGDLIWEDNFDILDTNVWTKDIGDGCNQGLCGFGNAELQSYEDDNVSIQPVPGEPGNNALAFQARRENTATRAFTSGKVESEDKLSVQYGLIEVRMQVPDLNTGLWPAAWLLGTSNLVWPAKGEIDMMEMGHRAEERARQGHEGVNMNNYVGANAIFADENGGVASIAFDTGFNQPYVAENSMANRFVTYRLYWEPTQIRYTIIDNGVESDLYAAPLPLDPNGITGVFNRPFYLILNLAVGGTFTDAAVNNDITANLPASVLIDYVRVYEWNGHGSVERNYRDFEPETGPFGVFTETTPTQNSLDFANNGEIFIWGGTMQEGNEPAFEGNEVISWETLRANDWFGGGVLNIFGKNMSGYVEDGNLRFRIKIPENVPFRIGITDNFTNESWVTFGANESKYGLVRNGEWGEVEIPLADFAGLIAFQDIGYMFAISSDPSSFPTSTFEFAIDDIVWDDGNGITTPPPPTDDNDNLALDGTANQLTTAFNGIASRAIDDNTSGVWNERSVTHTVAGVGQWWSVTLDDTYNIGDINIWNRTNCCSSRLDNITVTVEDGNENVVWSENITSSSATTLTVNAGGVAGNVIRITQNQNQALSLAEVQVYEFNGTPPPVANLIEAEDYTAMSGVQTQNTADTGGGLNVGFIDFNDWLEYEITVPSSGTYTLNLRIASPNSGANISLQVNGSNAGNVEIPRTGGWQNWETISTTINLAAGTQTLRLTSTGNGYNINWLEIESGSSLKAATSTAELTGVLELYPNPVTNELNVSLTNYEGVSRVEILDLKGQVLTQNRPIDGDIIRFDTSNLSNGLYLIRVTSSRGTTMKKFIK